MRCGGCQTVSYCNADCQRAHWKVHKTTCKASAAAYAAKNLTDALAGDREAQFNLGLAYALGMRVAKNYPEAVRWYRRAANAGHVKAQVNLATCYR
jgi:TPR repeat protein